MCEVRSGGVERHPAGLQPDAKLVLGGTTTILLPVLPPSLTFNTLPSIFFLIPFSTAVPKKDRAKAGRVEGGFRQRHRGAGEETP